MVRSEQHKQAVIFPDRRVWVVREEQLKIQEPEEEAFGYNDWDIYHGA